jgi:hypothetical protein
MVSTTLNLTAKKDDDCMSLRSLVARKAEVIQKEFYNLDEKAFFSTKHSQVRCLKSSSQLLDA